LAGSAVAEIVAGQWDVRWAEISWAEFAAKLCWCIHAWVLLAELDG
jgi:hypothetical protein